MRKKLANATKMDLAARNFSICYLFEEDILQEIAALCRSALVSERGVKILVCPHPMASLVLGLRQFLPHLYVILSR